MSSSIDFVVREIKKIAQNSGVVGISYRYDYIHSIRSAVILDESVYISPLPEDDEGLIVGRVEYNDRSGELDFTHLETFLPVGDPVTFEYEAAILAIETVVHVRVWAATKRHFPNV